MQVLDDTLKVGMRDGNGGPVGTGDEVGEPSDEGVMKGSVEDVVDIEFVGVEGGQDAEGVSGEVSCGKGPGDEYLDVGEEMGDPGGGKLTCETTDEQGFGFDAPADMADKTCHERANGFGSGLGAVDPEIRGEEAGGEATDVVLDGWQALDETPGGVTRAAEEPVLRDVGMEVGMPGTVDGPPGVDGEASTVELVCEINVADASASEGPSTEDHAEDGRSAVKGEG